MIKHKLLWIFLLSFTFSGCKTNIPSDTEENFQVDGHPAWIMQGNIYEVNVRQYTPEGTFNAFANHLQRLKDMGVQTLWFMPINPISVKERKGAMGSYYAIADYKAVNPEFGSLADWKNLVNKAHDLGLKVIIDWVPNHTGADHPWINSNHDFYLKNAKGEPTHPLETDWTDIRKLEFKGVHFQQLSDSMIAAMKYWITETDIDGFRVDVAAEVGKDFYVKAIPELRKEKNIFLLAEAEQPWLHEVGFDASYGWNTFHMMKRIAKGERKASALDSTVIISEQPYSKTAIRMFFTSNHDENSWNKADYETMPGEIHAPFAVLTQTLPKSVPLIYSGQEEPVLDSISFFYKDAIPFGKYQRAAFYKTLLELRKRNPALAANASFTKLNTGNDDNVYAFLRLNNGRKVLVVTNLSVSPQTFKISNASITGDATNVFDNASKQMSAGDEMQLPAWGYGVYEYR
jgi:alpha-amylase